ncbi:MAG: hypothetical protein A2086_03860 [Spirochaetes bacterium GWD1_27_9]|nr:MAG: hypothetical protein A2Z98_08725 [Spirochaetes bacterium GWB1_27_13]OHD24040.1 MAG: hypothetical protein A2Y34_14030 [Spirochaetes bacterium GWC1_27_15]OHD30680.1 MAG: hypothetical protein A2086_03860 [Spirochaetes bacterium GWD1_27_9]
MVKKVLIILSICFFIFSCTVNDNTGLIVFTNRSQSNLSFKFNSTDIGKLENGKTLDYWYFNNMSGNLNVSSSYLIYTFVADYYDESNETIHYSKNNYCIFKTGYKYNVDIENITVTDPDYGITEDFTIIVIKPGYKVGVDGNDPDSIHYPGDR